MNTLNEQQMRELDAWIFKHVFGGRTTSKKFSNGIGYKLKDNIIGEWPNSGGSFGWGWLSDESAALFLIPHYTTYPASAMAVLEKCAEKIASASLEIYQGADEGLEYNRCWCILKSQDSEVVMAETLPLAICLFAKKLFEVKP